MKSFAASALIAFSSLELSATAQSIDDCNVVWTTPGRDASGSMPIGNGELGLNVWVEEDGALLFYIARTDSWSEADRLLKLGRVRISLSPNPFAKGMSFKQELRLRDGRIDISAGPPAQHVELSILVDADSPTVTISGNATTPISIFAALESWRTKRRRLVDADELRSSWTMHSAPAEIEVWESADVVVERDTPAARDAVAWYHRNEDSVVPLTIRHQGLTEIADRIRDPLLHRTFGGRIEGHAFFRTGPTRLALEGVRSFSLQVTTHCAQTPTAAEWIEQVDAMARERSVDAARERTAKWWREFWDRSWIHVSGPGVPASADDSGSSASRITQAYALQRWMIACAGRGAFPPKSA